MKRRHVNAFEQRLLEAASTGHGCSELGPSDDTPSVVKLRRFEGNTVAGCFVGVSAIAFDALSSLPDGIGRQLPSSLRCTALVTIACLGSPPVSSELYAEQLGVLVLVLVSVALVGQHHGNESVRCADALFTLVAGCSICVMFVWMQPTLPIKNAPGAICSPEPYISDT